MILKILKKLKMKFHQMKMTVARSTAFEVAEIELSEIAQYVDAVFRFVVVVVSIAYLIDLRFDALIALIAEVADALMILIVAAVALAKFLI